MRKMKKKIVYTKACIVIPASPTCRFVAADFMFLPVLWLGES
jgi:hypothetical protein